MTFDWLDFLSLGENLMSSGREEPIDESMLRTAIGRMYYAVFGKLRNHYADVEEVAFSYGPNDHGKSGSEIRRKKGRYHAKDFHRMRDTRNNADYENDFDEDIVSATEKQLTRAKEILDIHDLLPT